jgi:hypothetical protein
MKDYIQQQVAPAAAFGLVAGEDYYSEGAVIVFTARYLLRRGYCCESGCRHCPYRKTKSPDSLPVGQVEE